jgi:hypothetical protein
MNILEKLRKQSTADRFKVTLTKADATALLEYWPGNKQPEWSVKSFVDKFLVHINNGVDLQLYTAALPIKIDLMHQLLIDQDKLLKAFILSDRNEMTVYISFVKSKPKTDSD